MDRGDYIRALEISGLVLSAKQELSKARGLAEYRKHNLLKILDCINKSADALMESYESYTPIEYDN